MNTATAAILAFALAGSVTSADARDPSTHPCVATFTGLNAPHPVIPNQPFVLNDPRSGLTLYLDSDGRHMTAKTRWGKIVWQHDLFADPRLVWELGPPEIQIPGEPHLSEAQQRQKRRAYLATFSIHSLHIASDCEARQIDRTNHFFRGHYVGVSPGGTKYGFLLDARTGDFLLWDIN